MNLTVNFYYINEKKHPEDIPVVANMINGLVHFSSIFKVQGESVT